MKKLLLICLPLIGTMAFAQAPTDIAKFGSIISKENLKQKLSIIASAEMEGRETASPGQKRAAAYIESEFKRMGLKPGNGDSYQQVYPVYQDALTAKTFSVNGRPFTWDQDYSLNLQTIATGNWSYEKSVFAGYGIVDTAKQINDYANLDVRGKLVFVLEGSASGTAMPTQGGMRAMMSNPASANMKMRAAIAKGAAGLFIISADFPKKLTTPTKGNMYLKAAASNGFLMATVSADVATALTGRTEN